MLSVWLPTAISNIALLLALIAVCLSANARNHLKLAFQDKLVIGGLLFWLGLGVTIFYSAAPVETNLEYWLKYKEFLWLPVFAGLCFSMQHKRAAAIGFLLGASFILLVSYSNYFGITQMLPASLAERLAPDDSDGPIVFKLAITHNFLMGLAACAFALACLHVPKYRLAFGLLATLALVNVMLMVNGRTGYLVLIALFLYAFYARFSYKGFVLGALIAVPTSLLVYTLVPTVHNAINEGTEEVSQWIAQKESAPVGSMQMRLNWWVASIEAISEKPVLGHGVGAYEQTYQALRNPDEFPSNNNPHNQYLLFAVQAGLLGLGLFFAWWVALWLQADKFIRTGGPENRIYLQYFQISWLAISLACLVNSFFLDHTEGILIHSLVGMLLLAKPPTST